MIGVCWERGRERISSAVSKPSIIGMFTSRRMTAKSCCSSARRASRPEYARTIFCPRSPRIASRASSLSGRSSTRRMLTRSSPSTGAAVVSGPSSAVTEASGGGATSRHLAVEALRELLVMRFVRGEARGLLHAQAQEAEADEALVEQAVHPLLQVAVEVDEDVAADDEMELVERPVRGQVVLGERDVAAQIRVEHRVAVARLVPAREPVPAARLQV